MGIIDIISQLRDMGFFLYTFPYIILYFLIFLISFYIINKIKFIENNLGAKSLINMIISSFISYILAFILLPSVLLIFAYFELATLILGSVIILASIIIWVLMLINAIRKRKDFPENQKVIWILIIILGVLMGGWAYLLAKKN